MSSGYMDCSCPTCFEIAVGDSEDTLVLCHACHDAGCDGERECQCAPEEPELDFPEGARVEHVSGRLGTVTTAQAGDTWVGVRFDDSEESQDVPTRLLTAQPVSGWVKVRFRGAQGATAGLVFEAAKVRTMSLSEISRNFPVSEARHMARMEVSPEYHTWHGAFHHTFGK